MCLGLHSCKVVCKECGTPAPATVSDIYSRMRLEQSIVCLYEGDRTDWCHHALALSRTAKACGVSQRFVEKVLHKHKATLCAV